MQDSRKTKRLSALKNSVDRIQRRIRGLQKRSARYSWTRLLIALLGVVTVYLTFSLGPGWLGWLVMGLFVTIFAVVAHYHRQVIEGITRHETWLQIKSNHIARMKLDWDSIPVPKIKTNKPTDPTDKDLNLTGPKSLHHLIDTAATYGGSARLQSWFLGKDYEPTQVYSRQALVRELEPLSNFRDRIALNAHLAEKEDKETWQGDSILRWLETHPARLPGKLLIFLGSMAVANIVFLILNLLSLVPAIWLFTLFLYSAIYLFNYQIVTSTFDDALDLEKMLRKLVAVLNCLEKYRYDSKPQLAKLCEPFSTIEKQPSNYLKRIRRTVAAVALKQNDILWLLLNLIVPWGLFFTYKLNRYKLHMKPLLVEWLDRLYELEALNSLANYAYLNPGFAYPEFVDQSDSNDDVVFGGFGLGHPLLPDEDRKTNDFSFESTGHIGIISGSNMSGKSTFLRTLGVNYILAYAGGPVCATAFQTIPFRIFTCIQVSDSVNDGISYFYAEVRRLKALLTELEKDHEWPLLFLIDEIFKGTNNRERMIGSRAYVQELAKGKGVGLIATHDLELVELADKIDGLHNYHFREEVFNGKMVFDYKLRPGSCPTSNALKIMQMEGLPT
jgi:hypothetical protein